ncbi:response regulator [Aureimonas fodinaquatilis]|uniref:response regulator n=1 Tax=Aureimonas fodinaquatilis TaxID=2565783 RepID=UPI00165D3DF8|nr:response regulator [Aureimonas fodinaquatilis]
METLPEGQEFTGLRGLVVEDNLAILLDTEQLMLESGMAAVFTAANVAQAIQIIENTAIDIALLDINLGAETSFALVPSLTQRRIPFVFASGYGEDADLPVEARSAPTIRKPYASQDLINALRAAL